MLLESGGEAAVVPHSVLARRRVVRVRLGDRVFVVRTRGRTTSALDSESIEGGRSILTVDVRAGGRPVPFDQPFWFAVAAFRPDVRIVR